MSAAPLAASERIACTTTIGSARRCSTIRRSAAIAWGGGMRASPLAANDAVYRPGVSSRLTSAGTPRASGTRCSAYATGHQLDTG